MSIANQCKWNNDRPCVSCVDDGHRLVCAERSAKISEDGFALIDIQTKCPKNEAERRVRKTKDKYGRKR